MDKIKIKKKNFKNIKLNELQEQIFSFTRDIQREIKNKIRI